MIDEYNDLNRVRLFDIQIKKGGLTVSVPVNILVEGILDSNHGVHRVLSALYHCVEQKEYCEACADDTLTDRLKRLRILKQDLQKVIEHWIT